MLRSVTNGHHLQQLQAWDSSCPAARAQTSARDLGSLPRLRDGLLLSTLQVQSAAKMSIYPKDTHRMHTGAERSEKKGFFDRRIDLNHG